jgi:antitoxin (DNA-binding transcriptional repressor) of toxin-antitoxin stability system
LPFVNSPSAPKPDTIHLQHVRSQKVTAISFLRNAKPVNVREAQAKLSQLIKSRSLCMVVSHGKPVSFLVPYEDMLDLVEMHDELKDTKLLREIARMRAEYARGSAVPAERLFRKMGR